MNFIDKLLRFILTSAVTLVITGVVASMILPKGLSLRQLPAFYKLVQNRNKSLDAWNFLDTLRNEEQMLALMQEMHGITPPRGEKTIATQVTHPEVFIDPAEFERIDKMNISNELKAQMKVAHAQGASIPKPVAPLQSATQVKSASPTNQKLEPVRAVANIEVPIPAIKKNEPRLFEAAVLQIQHELAGRQQKPHN